MSYANKYYEDRLTLIPNLRNAFSSLYVSEAPCGSIESALRGVRRLPVFSSSWL